MANSDASEALDSSDASETLNDQWLPAAKLLRPQGRRGELLADPQLDAAFFNEPRRLWLAPSQTGPLPSKADPSSLVEQHIEQAWQPTGRNAGRVVLKLRGVDTISAAEALAGRSLLLRVQDLPALDEDTFRVRDLVGCALYNGEALAGTVREIQFPVGPDGRTRLEDAPDLLAIQLTAEQDHSEQDHSDQDHPEPDHPEPDLLLIPFVRAWLVEIDIPGRLIRMDLPPGLLESGDRASPDDADEPDELADIADIADLTQQR